MRLSYIRKLPESNIVEQIVRQPDFFSRALHRTLHELQRLQAARTGEHVAAPSVVDVNIDVAEPPAPVNGADGGD